MEAKHSPEVLITNFSDLSKMEMVPFCEDALSQIPV